MQLKVSDDALGFHVDGSDVALGFEVDGSGAAPGTRTRSPRFVHSMESREWEWVAGYHLEY